MEGFWNLDYLEVLARVPKQKYSWYSARQVKRDTWTVRVILCYWGPLAIRRRIKVNRVSHFKYRNELASYPKCEAMAQKASLQPCALSIAFHSPSTVHGLLALHPSQM